MPMSACFFLASSLTNTPFSFCFFLNDTATTEIYTLSLHDALPILLRQSREVLGEEPADVSLSLLVEAIGIQARSEEHTSELQSPDHLVCRLLLEKKKTHCKITDIWRTESNSVGPRQTYAMHTLTRL